MELQEAKNKYYMFHHYKKWYSPQSYMYDEVANLLGIRAETMLSYILAKELPAEPVGNSYRIDAEDLDEFLLAKAKGMNLRRERRCNVG